MKVDDIKVGAVIRLKDGDKTSMERGRIPKGDYKVIAVFKSYISNTGKFEHDNSAHVKKIKKDGSLYRTSYYYSVHFFIENGSLIPPKVTSKIDITKEKIKFLLDCGWHQGEYGIWYGSLCDEEGNALNNYSDVEEAFSIALGYAKECLFT